MPPDDAIDPQLRSERLQRFSNIQRLSRDRSGHASVEHVRHQLYVGRDRESRANVLIKVTTRPGIVYELNLANEIATLVTINRDLPDSRYFPLLLEHGRLADSRVFVVMTLFDEWPLATAIAPDGVSERLVGHLLVALEVAAALAALHFISVFHIDLNPMNILYRSHGGRPVIRIVDFESSYELARHANGVFYNPPMTSGFSAPELGDRPPDARADVFSLGAVLYTMIAGYDWTLDGTLSRRIGADSVIDADLRKILLTATDGDRDRRYQSITEMGKSLGAYLESIWPGRS